MAANIIKRLAQLGILSLENMNNPSKIKSATNQYETIKKENSVFAKRERLAEKNNFDTVMDAEEFPKNITTPEKLQGEILIPLPGDPSNIGLLSQVGGIPVKSNVQGGGKFASKWKDKNLAWGSQFDAAKAHLNKVRYIEDTYGQSPLSNNTLMTNSSMRSPEFIRTPIFQQLENSPKLLKKDVLEFDERVRNDKQFDLSDWPGLFNGGEEYLANSSMRKRGKVLELMDQKRFRNQGFPTVQETIEGARDPRFAGSVLGDSGAVIVRVDPRQDLMLNLPDSIHKNYDTGIMRAPDSPVLQLERLVPYNKWFKDLYAEKIAGLDKYGRPLTVPNAIGAGNLAKDGFQRADQEWVDVNMAFMEQMKGNPKGMLAGGGASAGLLSGGNDQPAFMDRVNNPDRYPVINNEDGSISTHMMANGSVDGKAVAYPTIQMMPDGTLKQFQPREALDRALENKNVKWFDSDDEALNWASKGYKVGTPLDPNRAPAQDYEGDLMGGMDFSKVNSEQRPFLPTIAEYGKSMLRGAATGSLDTADSIRGLGEKMGFIPDTSKYMPDAAREQARQSMRDRIPEYERKYTSDEEDSFFKQVGAFFGL